MGLSIFEETFGKERNRFAKVTKREANVEHLVAITDACQRVVDTFRDPKTGQRYLVALSDQTEAYSDPDAKRIVVSYKPIFDKGLKVSTACTVMTGLVLHEIGHTLYTFPNHPAIIAAFGEPGKWTGWDAPGGRQKQWDQLAWTVLNIGDDARLEARMVEALPVAASVFPTMLHWVAISSGMVGNTFKYRGAAMNMADRVNFMGRSIRYPWTATWATDEHTRSERAWWINWGADFVALDDHDADGMVRLIKVALDRLRNAPDLGELPQPKPPTPTGPGPVGPTNPGVDDEDEDEPPTKGPSESKDPFGDDFDKDEDDDEDDDDLDGDDEDDEEEDDDEGNPVPTDTEESDEEPDDDGGSKVDAPDLGDEDGDKDDESGEVKDGDKEPDKWPQDFDAHNLQGNVDEINRGNSDWQHRKEGALVQKLLDRDRAVERISTDGWGTAKVEVRDVSAFINRGW